MITVLKIGKRTLLSGRISYFQCLTDVAKISDFPLRFSSSIRGLLHFPSSRPNTTQKMREIYRKQWRKKIKIEFQTNPNAMRFSFNDLRKIFIEKEQTELEMASLPCAFAYSNFRKMIEITDAGGNNVRRCIIA